MIEIFLVVVAWLISGWVGIKFLKYASQRGKDLEEWTGEDEAMFRWLILAGPLIWFVDLMWVISNMHDKLKDKKSGEFKSWF